MIDVRVYGAVADGVTDSIPAINAALLQGDIILQNGTFAISQSIKIPSNRTVYGRNAILKMKDGVYDNFFRNSNFDGGNVNVNVKGLGNFILDGNTVNNIESPMVVDNDYTVYPGVYTNPLSYKYIGFLLYNVVGFEVSGITFIDRPHFIGTISKSSFGVIDNLYFNYRQVTRNQDGIDLGWGSHDITFNNIRGHCGDDWIAIDVGNKGSFMYRPVGWNIGDIHDISYSNINVFTEFVHFCIIICGDGNKVYNISFDNVVINYCGGILYTGYTEFRTVAPLKEDISGITMNNVLIKTMRAGYPAFDLGENCQNITVTNFINQSPELDYREAEGLDVVNFSINGVQKSI